LTTTRLLQLAALAAVGAIAASGGSYAHASPAAASRPSGVPKFVARVDNPWFPLIPGTTFVYRGTQEDGPTWDVVTVTFRTKVIQGVRCTAVSDRLSVRGRLAERTTDWYAQDTRGNVWYFGEATAELDAAGRVTTREGSWQAGVHRARAGVFMPAHPKIGQSFRQEYYKGHAEDHFRVVSIDAAVHVPYAASRHALLTAEWSPLEPHVLDHKLYVRGIGDVKEETIKGGVERAVLVDVRR
jgi:hypothetical protein